MADKRGKILEIITRVSSGHDKGKSLSPNDIVMLFRASNAIFIYLKFPCHDERIFKPSNQLIDSCPGGGA